ncbi:hypothetical protein [Streptomyces sp. NPDC051109]
MTSADRPQPPQPGQPARHPALAVPNVVITADSAGQGAVPARSEVTAG